jgi:hypothetical protein
MLDADHHCHEKHTHQQKKRSEGEHEQLVKGGSAKLMEPQE